jgi:hypothetical protein
MPMQAQPVTQLFKIIPWDDQNRFLDQSWRNAAEKEVRSFLNEELRSTLSPEEYEAFQKHALAAPDEASRRKIREAIDRFISESLFFYGLKIFLLPEVLQRVSDWVLTERNGKWLCKELGDNLALLPKVDRREAKAPLGWWVRSRSAIIREVKVLRDLLRAKLQQDTTPTRNELLNAVLSTLRQNTGKFPKLIQIYGPFIDFVASNADTLNSLLAGEITSADFTGELIRYTTNYKPESARQIISRHNRT